MRAASLLVVLVAAKAAVVWTKPIGGGGWAVLALVWQDVAFALGFALVDRWLRRPALGWSAYALLAVYVTINVPIARAISSPLTWPMLRAADTTLWDSIAHYATIANLSLMACLLVISSVLPCVIARLRLRRPWIYILVAAGLAAVGKFNSSHVDTLGLERNAVAALITTAFPRVGSAPHPGDRRACPFEPSPVDDLSHLRGAAAGSNVLLVVLESTAAQYLRIYGAEEDPMPNLTRLAERGVTFDNAYVVYPESIKGLFALLTSTCPAFDTSPEDYELLDVRPLPLVLGDCGYRTALFHSGRFAYLGMNHIVQHGGFELSEDAAQIGGKVDSSFGIDEHSTVMRLLEWIDRDRAELPFFAAYLPVAGHHPYETPEPGPFAEDEEISRYRNALHYADEALGELLAGLRRRKLDQATTVIVCGDHGQAFEQHPGNYGHTLFLYEENVHVPLVIALPSKHEAMRSQTVASVIDIGPTVIDLLGLAIPGDYEGQSLLSPRPELALFFTDYSLPLAGLRDGRWKFIVQLDSERARLFDLRRDPDETVNLASQLPGRAGVYEKRLRQWCEAQCHRIKTRAVASF